VTAVYPAPHDYPGGKKDDPILVEFTVLGHSLGRFGSSLPRIGRPDAAIWE